MASYTEEVKEYIGFLWGKATTIGLAVGVAVLAVPVDYEILEASKFIRWSLFFIGIGVALLRIVAPPPKSPTDTYTEDFK